MKKQKSSDIRARIDFDLKQEFSDIFPDMSKKMIELIENSIENEKAYYLEGIKRLCSQDASNIKTLEDVINYVCEKYMILKQEDKAELKESNIIYELNQYSDEAEKRFGENGKELYLLVNKDLIHGLYKGSQKDRTEERISRLQRNKENILRAILNGISFEGSLRSSSK